MKTEITHTPEEAARWFKGILKNEQDRRRCLELLNEYYPDGLPENPNEEINALLYQAFPQLWGKNVGELSFAQRYPLIRDALAYQEGITKKVSTGKPTAGKDDGKIEKDKTEVWGEDADGNFTINGKKATKKQRQQACHDLKLDLPENYLDLLPQLEERARNLTSRQHLVGANNPQYESAMRTARAITKRLKSREVLRSVGPITAPPGEQPFSVAQEFLRLVVLQAQWEGTSPQQIIDAASGRKNGKTNGLVVSIEKQSATLNGVEYDLKSPQVARWLKVLNDHEGEWISGPQLKNYDSELDEARTDRLKKKLPKEIRTLIDSTPQRGSRLKLA